MAPELSVVMCVYNAGEELDAAVRSILEQDATSFEFVIVNDGADEPTSRRLRGWAARDARIRLLEQPNAGLTKALIRGCAEARAPIIVRQDADDVSLPGRLRALREAFARDPGLVLLYSSAESVGPCGELLDVVGRPTDPSQCRQALLDERVGPTCHGATAFRREAYEAGGGYRPMFRYGQDADLWLRLGERGGVTCLPQVLYRYTVHPDAISGARMFHQRLFGELGQACHAARRAGRPEAPLLAQAAELLERMPPRSHRPRADALYFIGSCLLKRRDARAAGYLWRAVAAAPWRVKPLLKALVATPLLLLGHRSPPTGPPRKPVA